MNSPYRFLFLTCIALSLLTGRVLAAAPGYKVTVEITFDEKGVAEDGKVVESDDPSGAQILNQIAVKLASQVKQPPRTDKEGKPMKYKVRAPFNFPVEEDEGAAANNAPKPSLHKAEQPTYPENLAAAGTVGGAILELTIGADGRVSKATVLRASHAEFAAAAQAAVSKWEFMPAKKDDVAVESRWRVAISFSVNGKDPDWKWMVAPRPSLGAFTVVRANVPAAEVATPAAPADKK